MKILSAGCLFMIVSAWSTLAARDDQAHPSFFFSLDDVPAIRVRSESTAWLRAMRQSVIAQADKLLETKTTPYALSGPDNGMGTAGRAVQFRVGILSLAGYLTGEEHYSRKGVAILLAVVRQFEADNPAYWEGHLQYSDATQALAIGYDLLYPYLTEPEREEVLQEIHEYGHLLYTDGTAWGAPSPGVTSCNHNAVHFGALGLAALALGDEPEWLNRATERISGYYRYFIDTTGYVTEGHAYSAYGQLGAVPFSIALQRAGGRDLMAEQPLLKLMGDQLAWLLLPFDGKIRVLNDNNPDPPGAINMVQTLRARNPVQLWAWLQAVGPHGTGRNGLGAPQSGFGELFPFIIGDEPLEPVSPVQAGWPLGKHYVSGRVFLRSSWDDPDAAHVAFTSGYDMHQGHNHQDENSVSFAALGEDFLTDPGYWPDASECHTTLRINGVEQAVGSVGRVVDYREDEQGAFVRGQAPEAYPLVPSFVGHAERKLYFVRGPQPYIVWRDDVGIELGRGSFEVVSRYITKLKNKIREAGDGVVIAGANGRASCLLLVFAGADPAKVSEDDLAGQGNYVANRNHKVVYADEFKRLSATVVMKHPRLLSIALPFHAEQELPTVKVDYDAVADRTTCRLTFPDGRVDTIVFDSTNAAFSREAETGRPGI